MSSSASRSAAFRMRDSCIHSRRNDLKSRSLCSSPPESHQYYAENHLLVRRQPHRRAAC
jgi:hypothetical protein